MNTLSLSAGKKTTTFAPLSPIPAFAPVFKALHGLANHLGISLPDEALVHHLLLRASDPEAGRTRHVTFLPTSE